MRLARSYDKEVDTLMSYDLAKGSIVPRLSYFTEFEY